MGISFETRSNQSRSYHGCRSAGFPSPSRLAARYSLLVFPARWTLNRSRTAPGNRERKYKKTRALKSHWPLTSKWGRGLASIGLVQTPTLLIHCDRDQSVPAEKGRLLAAEIPGARYVSLPSANHLM